MALAPDTPEGHVYYIRFSTSKGRFYKIGFTKANTVEQRFSYNGSTTYKLIDEVLFFKYSPFAYDIEQMLHSHLRPHQAYPPDGFRANFFDMSAYPLSQDGQSELYKEDVLGLDRGYKPRKTILGMGKTRGFNLVFGYGLDFSFYADSVLQDAKLRTYGVLTRFISEPFIYNRSDFVSEHGDWVIRLNNWASLNAAAPLPTHSLYGRTVHNAKPMPTTREGWLNLRVFHPVWGYVQNPPKEIGFLSNLETIILNSSNVRDIPDSVYNLKKLKVLDISGTDIESLSPAIRNLKALEVLDLRYCELLHSLPAEVFELPKLTIHADEQLASTLRQTTAGSGVVITT